MRMSDYLNVRIDPAVQFVSVVENAVDKYAGKYEVVPEKYAHAIKMYRRIMEFADDSDGAITNINVTVPGDVSIFAEVYLVDLYQERFENFKEILLGSDRVRIYPVPESTEGTIVHVAISGLWKAVDLDE